MRRLHKYTSVCRYIGDAPRSGASPQHGGHSDARRVLFLFSHPPTLGPHVDHITVTSHTLCRDLCDRLYTWHVIPAAYASVQTPALATRLASRNPVRLSVRGAIESEKVFRRYLLTSVRAAAVPRPRRRCVRFFPASEG